MPGCLLAAICSLLLRSVAVRRTWGGLSGSVWFVTPWLSHVVIPYWWVTSNAGGCWPWMMCSTACRRVPAGRFCVLSGYKSGAAGYTRRKARQNSINRCAGHSTASVWCGCGRGTQLCRGSAWVYPVVSFSFCFVFVWCCFLQVFCTNRTRLHRRCA